MKIKQKLLFVTIFSCMLVACKKGNDTGYLPEYLLSAKTQIGELSDSTFFSDVRCMSFYDGMLYFTEMSNGQLVILDKEMKVYRKLGAKGAGPGEFVGPSYFTCTKDSIFVLDEMTRKIVVFDGNRFAREITSRWLLTSFKNFLIDDGRIYFSGNTNNNSIACYDIKQDSASFFGDIFKLGSPAKNYITNQRFVVKNNRYLYAISDNQPVIEVYSLADNMLKSKYDYSFVELIKKTLTFVGTQPFNDSGYFMLVTDVNSTGNALYLLCNYKTDNTNFSCNHVIKFSINELSGEIRAESVYKLPQRVYLSFCIDADSNSMYAYDYSSSRIEVLSMNAK